MSEQKETTFSWTIDGFDMCPLPRGESLESQIFSIDALKTTKFSLNLYPRGHEENDYDNYVSIYLRRHNDELDDKICVEYVVGLIDTWNDCTNFQRSEYFFERNSSKGYNKFYERNMLLNSRYFFDNKLIVFCRLFLREPKANHHKEISQALTRDFTELFETRIHSDMILVINGENFNVHRVILENRCPTLMAQMKLKEKNIYNLPRDMRANVIWSLLYHLYTGTFVDNEMLKTVLVAAHSYGLSELKKSFFPKPIGIITSTKVIISQAQFQVNLREILLDLKAEISYLVLSDEIPDWSWVKISLTKIHSDNCYYYEMKLQRLYKKEITFIQCEIHYYNSWLRDKNQILMKCEHLFETEDEWVTQINIIASSFNGIGFREPLLHFKIRTSVNNGKYRETDTVIELSGDCSVCIDESGIFQNDLRKLYMNMEFTDLILCVGNEQLPAHKGILCARSQVFLKMFEHGTLEQQTGIIKIEDVDVETMKSILMYMYCGDVVKTLCVAQSIKIYIAAEKYQLLDLREECCKYLKSNIRVQNVGDLIVLADLHHDESLKKCAYNFVTSHPKEIIDTRIGLDALKNGSMNLYHDILNMLLDHLSHLTQ